MKCFVIVVGYNLEKQGVVCIDIGEIEFVWNFDLVKMIEDEVWDYFDFEVKIFFCQSGFGYICEICCVYEEIDCWGVNVMVEFYFNFFVNVLVFGIEILIFGMFVFMVLVVLVN